MDFIVNKVMQLEVVHYTYGYGVIKLFARTSVIDIGFEGFVKTGFSERLLDVLVLRTVKYRGGNLYKSARSCCVLCGEYLLFEVIVNDSVFKLFSCL